MSKIVNETELVFGESDINENGILKTNFRKKIPEKSITKIILPDGLKMIPDKAFKDCKSLEEIHIPDGVTKIGEGAFDYCKSLKEINIPDGVTEIGREAFVSCESLKKVNIPDGMTQIYDGAFWGCESLKEINIPDGVTEIDDRAFWGCESLEEIYIPDSVTKIGHCVFADCISVHYKGYDITDFIDKYGSKHFDVIMSLNDNDLPLTDDMLDKAVEAKKADRLRGFIVKTKKKNEKRLSERELPDISDNQDCNDFQFD